MEHLESVLLHPGLNQPIPKPPDEGGPPRCLYDIVSPSFTLSTVKHSPELSDGPMLPIVVSRQCDPNIVSKTSGVYGICSPSLETARKQSITSVIPSSIEGEGQLARAAAYIQECIKHCSVAFNGFPCCSSKEPPNKPLEFASIGVALQCLKEDIISKERKAGKLCCLPVHRPEEAVESDRHSNERLIETKEVSEELERPALAENRRSSCEPHMHDWKAIQDGIICFAVSQEASTVEETTCMLQQSHRVTQ